ncbi:MAG: YceI family protein [Gammaproteobacteria bacterium]|nr:YceI family protein [Gammaproteobacteria bacterium]MBU1447363.1 YceI family protein [Gammaproteobacteria bacterium]
MKRTLTTIIATLFATTAYAAPETYMIEPTHSMPRFEYSHFGYSVQLSRFDKISGSITLDRAKHKGSVDVTIDATSVNTGSALFNQHIQAADFFDTEMFPTITYKSNKVKFDGDKVMSVEGDLTIKGITKPVTLTVNSFLCMPHPMVKKEACGVTATAKVKRSDFDMAKNVPYVGDEVTLTLPVEAIKQ